MTRQLRAVGGVCAAVWAAGVLSAATAHADDWPQWRGPNRDGVWHETGVLESFPSAELKPRWTAPIGSGYGGPTVADGRVYVMDRVDEPKQIEGVHCFDAKTGRSVWSHTYPCTYEDVSYTAGPRTSVSIADGRAFALGTMGHLHAFDAAKGDVLWKHDLNEKYEIRMPIWGISASPLVDGDRVIVQIGGSNGACLVAFDAKTGREVWRALEDRASYAAPILTKQAGKNVLVCWTGDHIAGLDPKTGKVHWKHPFEVTRMVISIATPVIEGDRLFVTSFYDGAMMLRLDPDALRVEELWHRRGPNEKETEALQSIISTPYMEGDYVYGVDSYGEFRCLDAKTGERLWEDQSAVPRARWSTIHMVRNGTRMWMFNERGELLITKLWPTGLEIISRAKLIEPTQDQLRQRGGVCWAHPAYANKHVFARNDRELVCASLAAD